MFKNIAAGLKARQADQKGFTLIELIIVIAIIGILVAIAIPVYGAIQGSARNNTTQSSAKNGLTAVSAALADDDTATTAATALASVNNARQYVTATGTTSDTLCVSASWKSAPADNTHAAREGVTTKTAGPGCTP